MSVQFYQRFELEEKSSLPSESSLAAKALLDQSQAVAQKAHTDLHQSSKDLATAQETANKLASIVARYDIARNTCVDAASVGVQKY
jgi:hypothetical protein